MQLCFIRFDFVLIAVNDKPIKANKPNVILKVIPMTRLAFGCILDKIKNIIVNTHIFLHL